MESQRTKITHIAQTNDANGIVEMLKKGLEPNFEGGWPLRLAARSGSYSVAKALIHWGANPHLPGETGASTLQLAVYSGLHWQEGSWEFLLSCCDSSQLADGAGVAIVFKQLAALRQILRTGRCNTNVSTTLTGRTIDSLAKAYNVDHIAKEVLTSVMLKSNECLSPALLDPKMGSSRQGRNGPSPRDRALSPSVAEFFEKSVRHAAALSPLHLHSAAPAASAPAPAVFNVSQGSPLMFRSPASTVRK